MSTSYILSQSRVQLIPCPRNNRTQTQKSSRTVHQNTLSQPALLSDFIKLPSDSSPQYASQNRQQEIYYDTCEWEELYHSCQCRPTYRKRYECEHNKSKQSCRDKEPWKSEYNPRYRWHFNYKCKNCEPTHPDNQCLVDGLTWIET